MSQENFSDTTHFIRLQGRSQHWGKRGSVPGKNSCPPLEKIQKIFNVFENLKNKFYCKFFAVVQKRF